MGEMRCEDYIQFVKKVPFLNSTDLVGICCEGRR